eukprot:TRINITY_DN921_c0_g1_i1.p1 TRINITY_DN921_c0_g1~~TRINITY_DN921_c0_g1_i1.p1  ORF type:complete len:121 (-),score=33.41 TRINITY_DN921_c0_g1_i1:156-518(-)
MNRPDDYELFVLAEGQKKLTIQPDTKVKNSALFIIQKEEHTLGNIIRMQLHKDKDVVFAGYRMPHPLEHAINVRVTTTEDTTPEQAFKKTLDKLVNEYSLMEERFKKALSSKQKPDELYM